MLIKLTKNWSLYKSGQIVDVYNSKGQQMIRDGIGFDSEKPVQAEPKKKLKKAKSVFKKIVEEKKVEKESVKKDDEKVFPENIETVEAKKEFSLKEFSFSDK